MNAADIGRKKIEDREAAYVSVGECIVDPNGRDYEVKGFDSHGEYVYLDLQPVGQCGVKSLPFRHDEIVRVRR
jgi:hypothetical protein